MTIRLTKRAIESMARARPQGWASEIVDEGVWYDDQLELAHADLIRISAKYPRGLGDEVAYLVAPIAALLDRSLGTRLSSCPACSARQAKLNAIRLPKSFAAPLQWLIRSTARVLHRVFMTHR